MASGDRRSVLFQTLGGSSPVKYSPRVPVSQVRSVQVSRTQYSESPRVLDMTHRKRGWQLALMLGPCVLTGLPSACGHANRDCGKCHWHLP